MFPTKLTVYRLPHCPPDQLSKAGDSRTAYTNAGLDIRAAEDKVIYPSYLARQDESLNLIEWKIIGKLDEFNAVTQAQIQHAFDLGLEELKIDEEGNVLQIFYKPQLIRTGIVIKYDTLSWSLLTTRSSVGSKQLLSMPHGVGVIDYSYSGPEDELLISFTSQDVRIIKKGDRLTQLIPMSQYKVEYIEGNITRTENEDSFELIKSRGGFGSTGYN